MRVVFSVMDIKVGATIGTDFAVAPGQQCTGKTSFVLMRYIKQGL